MFNHGRRNGALSGCVRVSGLPIGIQMLGALRTLSGDVVASTAAFHVAAVPCASLRGGGGGGGGVPSGGSAAAATLSAVADGRSAEGDAERDGKDGDAVPAVGSTRTAAFGAAARRRSAASRNAKRSANSAKSARGAKGGTPQSPTRSGASLWKRVRTMRRGGRPAEVSDPSELPSLSAEATPSERHQYMELLMGAMQRAAPRVVGGRRRRRCLPLAAEPLLKVRSSFLLFALFFSLLIYYFVCEPLLKLASRLHASLRCEDGSAGIDPHLADGVALLLGDCIAMVASLAMGAAGRGERGAVSHSRAALAFSQRAASRSEARPLRGAACCDFSDVLELRSLQVLFLRIIGDAHGVVTAPHRESHGDTAPARRLAYELITALLWRPELCEMHLLGFGPELAEIDDWVRASILLFALNSFLAHLFFFVCLCFFCLLLFSGAARRPRVPAHAVRARRQGGALRRVRDRHGERGAGALLRAPPSRCDVPPPRVATRDLRGDASSRSRRNLHRRMGRRRDAVLARRQHRRHPARFLLLPTLSDGRVARPAAVDRTASAAVGALSRCASNIVRRRGNRADAVRSCRRRGGMEASTRLP